MILGDYRSEVISDEGHRLQFDVSDRVKIAESDKKGFEELFEEFIRYKGFCADDGDIPAPLEHDQKEYASSVDNFGKDKPNHFPKPDAKIEKLHHVHVYDGKTDAQLDKWIEKPQNQRVCDTLLFYSYFQYDDVHHFFILQFVTDPDGHKYQKDDEKMSVVVQCAKEYRKSITTS